MPRGASAIGVESLDIVLVAVSQDTGGPDLAVLYGIDMVFRGAVTGLEEPMR